MANISQEIKGLLKQRNKLRKEGRFEEADVLRQKIQSLEYNVVDQEDKTVITKIAEIKAAPKKTFLVIFGSGEIAHSAVKVHEYALKNLNKQEVKIAIISTPAGFQPNVKVVHEEIKEFFLGHLQNFHPQVKIVYANTKIEANDLRIIKPVQDADYIFIGPGSPTYAVKTLKDTLLYQKIIEKVKSGTTLAIASAASIAFSKYALPVYEIYKAGSSLYWEEGLDFYTHFLRPLTIIPHFNNNEGGQKNDTSRCFVGLRRFNQLLNMLPKGEEVWGIDEHTAVLIETKTKKTVTMGKGKLHMAHL
ncbi:MAG: Type 1 glutamine amidotransferase-like domain-containing protein [bacterium]|nr:Type 1 glutamine amidotransferase-like domain-containing protein [bacterium]